MCTIQQATAIYEMYQGFCNDLQTGTMAKDFSDYMLQDIDKNGGAERLLGLKVELPIEKIKQIFEQYHIIVLRDAAASKSLLVGCGNSPITDMICKGVGHNHEHEAYVTIDPDITKNPTVVGAFGSQESLHAFLPKKYYTKLINEASSIAQTADEISKSTLDCMAEDFKCFEMGSAGDLKEEKSFQESKIFNQNSWLY